MNSTINQNTNRQNLLQLLWLRLIAIFSQLVTIFLVDFILGIELPVKKMLMVLMCLLITTLISFYRYKNRKNITDKILFLELIFDVIALALQLYFSGGISNPFISLFLLQVIIGAILLKTFFAYILTILTIFCYVFLSFYYHELHAFHHHGEENFFNLHLNGMLISYIISASLLLVFITRINKNIKQRDQKINLLKQQSLQKEQLVKMGLLATGAAHEISTPLSTISVIISDWKNMNLNQNLLEDVLTIEAQINRCKKIISEILLSSGKRRLEEAKEISAKIFFNQIFNQWKNLRKAENVFYSCNVEDNKKIIADENLLQAFFNVFDNALEESANFMQITINSDEKEITILVEDKGSGFDEQVIKNLGQLNFSTKNSTGLGLFLAINILERFGGKLKIKNLPKQGAQVIINIPIIT
jgi:two-component system sensor histidine kinase RegB